MNARVLVGLAASALFLAACGSSSEIAIEQLIESGEGISNVAMEDGEVTIEFDESEGGGSLVLGGGEVPASLPIPVPDGGQVVSSIEHADTFAVVLQYSVGRYGEILSYYEDWVTGQATDSLTETGSANPRSDGWIGEIGDASFGIALLEGLDDSGNSVVSVILNWEG